MIWRVMYVCKYLRGIKPDLDHPYHGPHWDYYGPNFPDGIRIYPDRWEHK
jgi:hypothetical protein